MKKNKNKKKTFAQRAIEIEKKYPRAKFDAIEKRDLEAELTSLMQEQEQVRATMGLNEGQTQEFKYGGKPQYDGLNDTQYIQEDNRSGWQKLNDRIYGNWEVNKPQLLKDFPILDPVSFGLQYITGNTPDSDMTMGMPGLTAAPKTYVPAASRFWPSKPPKKSPIQRLTQEQKLLQKTLDKVTGTPVGRRYKVGARSPKGILLVKDLKLMYKL